MPKPEYAANMTSALFRDWCWGSITAKERSYIQDLSFFPIFLTFSITITVLGRWQIAG